MKKLITSIIVVVLVLTFALTLLTACQEEIDYDKTIVFYSSQGDKLQQITAKVIKAFEDKYPGWSVKHDTTAGDYDDLVKLITDDINTGKYPDLAYCYPDHVAGYVTTKVVVDMNKYFDSEETYMGERIGFTDEEQDDFVANFLAEGTGDKFTGIEQYGYESDALLTLPFIKSTELLYYNETAVKGLGAALKAAGKDDKAALFVDDEGNAKIPTTWDEMWAQCQVCVEEFKNSNGEPLFTPLTYDSEANWFITACAQNGFKYTSGDVEEHYPFYGDSTNREKIAAWLKDLNDKYQKKYFITARTLDSSGNTYTSSLFTKGIGKIQYNGGEVVIDSALMEGGGSLYTIGSSGGATYQNITTAGVNTGVAAVPGTTREGGVVDYSAILQGPSFVMLRGGNSAANPDEKEMMTWLFLKMMLSAEWQVQFADSNGYNPSVKSAYNQIVKDDNDDEMKPYDEIITSSRATLQQKAINVARTMSDRFFTSPAFDGSTNARANVQSLMVEVLNMSSSRATIDNIREQIKNAYIGCGGLNY